MKPLIIFALAVLFTASGYTQPPRKVDILLRGSTAGRAALSMLSGETVAVLDSITTPAPGHFTFDMNRILRPGFYRLSFDSRSWIDFVHDGEDIRIETDAAHISDSLRVLQSESNRLYNEFVRLSKEYKTKAEILHLVIARYPGDDPYHATTLSALSSLQDHYTGFVDSASRARPGSFVARYIRSAQLPVVKGDLPPEDQLDYLKAHALDHVDFADADLTRSDLFSAKSIEYLTYFRNPRLPKNLLEKEFNKAVDSILTRARVEESVYAHVTEYLIDGFKKFGFEECIDYIIDNYVVKDDLCLDEGGARSATGKMIEQRKLFVPGAVLPAITLPDSTGRTIDFTTLPAERIMVVFYAAGCPHCRTMIPKLKEAYAGRKPGRTEVVAVALDGSREEWLGFVREQKPPWISVSDLLGWSSPLVEGYRIYATPTMVVVDREMRFIAAPRSVEEAKEWL